MAVLSRESRIVRASRLRREMHAELHHARVDLKRGTRRCMHSSDSGAFASVSPTKVRSCLTSSYARNDADETHVRSHTNARILPSAIVSYDAKRETLKSRRPTGATDLFLYSLAMCIVHTAGSSCVTFIISTTRSTRGSPLRNRLRTRIRSKARRPNDR